MPATIQTHATHLKAAFFNGFADPSRLAILESLRNGPLTVGEIVEATGLSQPNTSNHLRCLRDCGVLVSEKEGRYVYYELGDARIETVLRLADEWLDEVADGVIECTHCGVRLREEPATTEPSLN